MLLLIIYHKAILYTIKMPQIRTSLCPRSGLLPLRTSSQHRRSIKNQIFDTIFGLHISYIASKHHMVWFANLPQNIDKWIIVHFTRHIKPFRVMIATNNTFFKLLMQFQVHKFLICIMVDQVVFIGFQTYFFKQII